MPRIRSWQRLNPPPVRDPIPLLIGGGDEKVTLKLAAQYADMWNSFGPPETYKHKNQVLDNWCREVDREPAAIERTVSINTRNLDQLDGLIDAGATHIIVEVGAPFDMAPVKRLVEWRAAWQ